MGHQLIGRQSVTLEGFGGLITIANPQDLPEGASPRNWDVGFTIGGVGQRDGLVSSIVAPSTSLTFLYAKTFSQPSGQINTLVKDASTGIWKEDVSAAQGTLTRVFNSVQAGNSMFSTSVANREYMCFPDPTLTVGGDIPRQWGGPSDTNFDRISQVAPGAAPSFNATLTSATAANITAWSITSNVVTFTAVNSFTAGEIVTVSNLTTGSFLNSQTFTISSQGLSGTQFQVAFIHANASATENGLATPQYSYPVTSIIQNLPGYGIADMLWSDGPGSTNQGTVATVCYQSNPGSPQNSVQDATLAQQFQNGIPVYVFISGAQFGNGTQLVTSIGIGTPPGAQYARYYFTFNMPGAGFQHVRQNGNILAGTTYQLTFATITAASPVPGIALGDQVQISGANVSNWNATWTVTQALAGFTLSVIQTSMSNFVGKYYYTYVSGGLNAPAANALVGQLVTVTGTLNGNNVFNVNNASISTNGTDGGGSFFTISGFNIGSVPAATETGTATTSGTVFQIDPGSKTVGTQTSPIYSSAGNGFVNIVGSVSGGNVFPLTAGTRQGVCLFITRNGAITPASVPVTFTTTAGANFIQANNLPIGPPDVIARVVAITEAGQNGIPGAFFYYIPVPVQSVLNNVAVLYSATVVQDNTSTSARFTFDDNTLLNATEIDIQGQNYFNTVELGNAGWNIAYGNRMFYGLVQNKVYNFNNMSFDGGYLSGGSALRPLGWGIDVGSNPSAGNPAPITSFAIASNVVTIQAANGFVAGTTVGIDGMGVATYLNGNTYTVLSAGLTTTQFAFSFTHADVVSTGDVGLATPLVISGTLLVSPTFGNSYYIQNQTGATQATFGMITQSAYQDAYQVNILNPQVTYSVRVTARCPSGIAKGNLIVDLTTNNTATYGYSGYGINYGVTYQAFVVPMSSMSGTMQTFSGVLLSTPFATKVPPQLLLRVWAQNIVNGGDVEVERVEVYPTSQPMGFPTDAVGVIGSYVNQYEAFDIVTGVMNLSQGNQQQCYGAAVFNDIMYFLKDSSILSTSQTPGQEPGSWAINRVNDKVGACGIYAYDLGKNYLVTACRAGVFAFNGGEPGCINWEIRELWNAINWNAARSIWVRNDVDQHRLYVGVPLPTGAGTTAAQWLPNAPVNAAPTTPNVILVLDYLGLETFNELVGEAGMHTTMFGTLADVDMRRKWTVYNIASPNGAFLTRSNGVDKPLMVCNGIKSGKVYSFSSTQNTDDGATILWDYCTYGFVAPAKSKENPLLGFHRKRYTKMQITAGQGNGALNINMFKEDITKPVAWTVWNPPQIGVFFTEFVRNLNIGTNRLFVEFSQNTNGATCNLSRLILVGNMDLHAPMPSIPGK
jgi:hypothetical protein